jgi:hypothetical protein
MSPVAPSKARQERESAAERTYAALVAVLLGLTSKAVAQHVTPALGAAHRVRGTRDRVRVPVALENTTWKVIGCLTFHRIMW